MYYCHQFYEFQNFHENLDASFQVDHNGNQFEKSKCCDAPNHLSCLFFFFYYISVLYKIMIIIRLLNISIITWAVQDPNARS